MEEVKPLRSTSLIKDKLMWKLSKHGAYTVKQRVSKAKASTGTSARETKDGPTNLRPNMEENCHSTKSLLVSVEGNT
jgi:hypothetical protein